LAIAGVTVARPGSHVLARLGARDAVSRVRAGGPLPVARWFGASIAHIAVVWARTDDGVRGFLVPTSTPGFKATDIAGKLAMRASIQLAMRASIQCDKELNNCASLCRNRRVSGRRPYAASRTYRSLEARHVAAHLCGPQ
jgi:alkylation response protein AidB-like acyl-CoA dehydrogenase